MSHARDPVRSRFRGAVFIAAVVAISAMLSGTAAAAGWDPQRYSRAGENSVGAYTGMQVQRKDQAVTQMNSLQNCTFPFTGNAVFQTQWVQDLAGENWLEIGTGHQCNDTFRYWFWGYAFQDEWLPQWTHMNPVNGDTHFFRILRSGGSTWTFYVDGTSRGSMTWARTFPAVWTGLESYNSTAHVAAYNHNMLRYTVNDGGYISWAGQDSQDIDAPLCGSWELATAFRVGLREPC